jgi:hypothetical protein
MEDLHKKAEQIQNKLKNYIDMPEHPTAQALTRDIDRLIQDIRAKKNPLSIENRIKDLIKHIESFVDDKVMDFRHADDLLDNFNSMRQDVRSI